MYLSLEHYERPSTVEECLRLLHHPDEEAAILAGGTELNVRGHEALERVVDIQGLGIDRLRVDRGEVRIGAGTTLARIAEHRGLAEPPMAALREAALAFANVAIQNRSTMGGRIMIDRPDQDLPPALAVLGARLRLAHFDRAEERVREVEIDYPTRDGARAALEGALLLEVIIPVDGTDASALRRMGRSAVDAPLATVAVAIRGDRVRVAANMQGSTADSLRLLEKTEALASAWLSRRPEGWRDEARASLAAELEAYGDDWASGEYRRDLGTTLGVRALAVLFGEEELS
ncbi:MAG: hypothetical protein CME06_08395 [Gemmatimonadetes bacterium]|nr:hypothetical protein [Gemmatimonadota bacterium]